MRPRIGKGIQPCRTAVPLALIWLLQFLRRSTRLLSFLRRCWRGHVFLDILSHEFTQDLRRGLVLRTTSLDELLSQFTLYPDAKSYVLHGLQCIQWIHNLVATIFAYLAVPWIRRGRYLASPNALCRDRSWMTFAICPCLALGLRHDHHRRLSRHRCRRSHRPPDRTLP